MWKEWRDPRSSRLRQTAFAFSSCISGSSQGRLVGRWVAWGLICNSTCFSTFHSKRPSLSPSLTLALSVSLALFSCSSSLLCVYIKANTCRESIAAAAATKNRRKRVKKGRGMPLRNHNLWGITSTAPLFAAGATRLLLTLTELPAVIIIIIPLIQLRLLGSNVSAGRHPTPSAQRTTQACLSKDFPDSGVANNSTRKKFAL